MLQPPGINHVWRNVFHGCDAAVTGNEAYLDLLASAVVDRSDHGSGHDELTSEEPMAPPWLAPVPFRKIGLYEDDYRPHAVQRDAATSAGYGR